MNEAIQALTEAYHEEKARADEFESMSILDFALYAVLRFFNDLQMDE